MKRSDMTLVYTPKLRTLRPLLTAWISSVTRYCELQNHEDNPWWFNERASLSTLAGAAWTMPGWAAIEEFATKKRGKVPSGRVEEGELRNGRCDLYVCTKTHNFALEAKQVWQSIGPRTDGLINVRAGIDRAWKDAGDLHIDEGDHRLAATFVVPFFPGKAMDGRDHAHEIVEEWLEREPFYTGAREPAAYAYVFPAKCKNYFNDLNERIFPGIALVIEERKQGNPGVRKAPR